MVNAEVSRVPGGSTAPTARGPVADELRARRVLLVDEAGKTRRLLGVEEGAATTNVYHEAGRNLVSLSVLSSGTSALDFAGEDGIDRAWLEVRGNPPVLVFRDEFKEQRVVLGGFTICYTTGVSERRPTASLVLFDKDGTVRSSGSTVGGRSASRSFRATRCARPTSTASRAAAIVGRWGGKRRVC